MHVIREFQAGAFRDVALVKWRRGEKQPVGKNGKPERQDKGRRDDRESPILTQRQ